MKSAVPLNWKFCISWAARHYPQFQLLAINNFNVRAIKRQSFRISLMGDRDFVAKIHFITEQTYMEKIQLNRME